MKLAYIIVAHFNHEQTLRLFNKLNKPDTNFVFHISKKCEPHYFETIYKTLKNHKNCYFAKRVNIRWGNFSFVQAVFNAFDMLFENQIDFDYVFLLSGQDYPLKSHEEIIRVLKKHNGKQFLENKPFNELPKIRNWIESYHFWVGGQRFWYPHHKSKNVVIDLYNHTCSLFLQKNHHILRGYVPYKGSTWWTLTKDCIEFLYQQIHSSKGKELIKYFKHTWHPTESFIQTILMNSIYREQIINDHLRFILWPENDHGHPDILTESHYVEMISSNRLFGRKFDPRIDSSILNLIDEQMAATE